MNKIIALLIAVLLVLSLVACGSNKSPSVLTQTVSENNLTETSSNIEDSSNPSSSVGTSSSNNSSKVESTSSAETSSNTITSNSTSSEFVSSDIVSDETSSSGTSSSEPNLPAVSQGAVKPENYHCYSELVGNKKTLYNALLSAASRMDSAWINITVEGNLTAKDVALSFYALQTDHPELFWLPSQYYVKLSTNKVSFLFVGEEKRE